MTQQVNLFQQRFRPVAVRLPFSAILLLSLVLAGVLGITSAFSYRERSELQTQVSGLESRKGELSTQLAALEKQAGSREPSRLLESRVHQLAADVSSRRHVVELLKRSMGDEQRGFSAHLEGLARQHVQGTWITRVRLARKGRDLILGGNALHAELVPAYLQRLSAEQVFDGIGLEAMNLRRAGELESVVGFELRTRVAGEGS